MDFDGASGYLRAVRERLAREFWVQMNTEQQRMTILRTEIEGRFESVMTGMFDAGCDGGNSNGATVEH